MVGPAVGGFVLALWLPAAYLLSAAGTAVFMIVLLTLPVPEAERSRPGNMLRQVGEGIAFVWRQRLLLGAISMDLFAVLLGGAVYLLPVYVRNIIDLEGTGFSPEQALGWLRAAPAAGALVTALLLAHLPPIRKAGRSMLLAVAAFGAVTIVFGLSRNFWLSLAMLALTGTFDNISVVIRHTLVMLVTPNAMRGRVAAVNSIFIGSSNQLGGFESGTVAQWLGPVVSVVSGGIGTLAVVAAWAGLFPGLRRFGSLADARAVHPDAPPTGRAHPGPDPGRRLGPATRIFSFFRSAERTLLLRRRADQVQAEVQHHLFRRAVGPERVGVGGLEVPLVDVEPDLLLAGLGLGLLFQMAALGDGASRF